MPSLESSRLDEGNVFGSEGDAARAAALLGVHLVSQVLEEASTVANASLRMGWPWTCVLSVFKDLKNGNNTIPGREDLFEILQGDTGMMTEYTERSSNVTTSTPHKDETMKMKPETSFIGQGDEEIDMGQSDLSKSTSMFINHLFDMSDVEQTVMGSEVENIYTTPEMMVQNTDEVLKDVMLNIMENLFHSIIDVTSEHEAIESQNEEKEKMTSTEESCHSFLTEAYAETTDGKEKDVEIYVEGDNLSINDYEGLKVEVQAEIHAELGDGDIIIEQVDAAAENIEKSDAARFENAYLSLNRDYEQGSDDGEPVLQDPKGLILQDVELFAASTSDEDTSSCREAEVIMKFFLHTMQAIEAIDESNEDSDGNISSSVKPEVARKELAATSAVSGVSGSRKSHGSLVSRCRTQGARLLACLRGWWRRKIPGKRKETRPPGSIRGLCPLSPDARRRAASLLDQRELYSPGASRSVVWKFNTVNEALVNSSRWKDYTFEVKPGTGGDSEFC